MSEDGAARQQQDETRDNWVLRAGAWNEQADHLARLAGGLNEPLIAAAGVTPGHQVLDLASGVGEPAISIAALVGPDGSVTASDLVAEMLAGTERRAKEQGVANMAFRVTPMEELPFDDDRFDVVTCRLGLMYTPSPERALAQARRVLRPSGRAAFLVWGPKADNSQFGIVDRVLDEVTSIDPHEGAFTPTRLGNDGALNALFEAAGFSRPQLALRLGAHLAKMDDVERQRIDDAMREAYVDLLDGDRVQLQVHARIGVGTV
jgi:SAM-dependent methyltransferase